MRLAENPVPKFTDEIREIGIRPCCTIEESDYKKVFSIQIVTISPTLCAGKGKRP